MIDKLIDGLTDVVGSWSKISTQY